MTEIGFAPKEIIPQAVCRLELLSAEKVDAHGPQIYLKLKVVGRARNKLEFGTIAPVPPEEKTQVSDAESNTTDGVDFSDISF